MQTAFDLGEYQNANSFALVIGMVAFAFQIYCDFSGYSDIAIGVSKLFGIHLMRNFAFPYFSRDIAEFWRRWHISLSTWFRDYVYIPLGGSRGGNAEKLRNVFIIFLLSAIWHGANWTFLAWGLLHALYFIPSLLIGRHRSHLNTVAHDSLLPSLAELTRIGITFLLICIAWVFFRSENISSAFLYLFHIIANFESSLVAPLTLPFNKAVLLTSFSAISLLISFEWFNRRNLHALDFQFARWLSWPIYSITIFLILIWGNFDQQEFIYFQF